MNERNRPTKERRRTQDWAVRGTTILTVMAWLLSFGAVLVLDIASPTTENMLTHLFDGTERVVWNENMILLAYVMLIFSLAACITATVFHLLRLKRKTDKFKISVFLITAVTVIGFILFLFRFAGQLF